jgi:hypothetical protein
VAFPISHYVLLPVFSVLRHLISLTKVTYFTTSKVILALTCLDVCHDVPRCEKSNDVFLLRTMELCRLQTGAEAVSARNAVYFQSHIAPSERLWA